MDIARIAQERTGVKLLFGRSGNSVGHVATEAIGQERPSPIHIGHTGISPADESPNTKLAITSIVRHGPRNHPFYLRRCMNWNQFNFGMF